MTKKNEAGFTGIFASSSDSNCASCSRNRAQDILVEDVVPLTPALYDYLDASPGSGGKPLFDPSFVLPALTFGQVSFATATRRLSGISPRPRSSPS